MEPHGILVIDKPQGVTSHDVVSAVRKGLQTRAVGHAGTLDPMATGVLVVLVGNATRLSDALMASRKQYEAEIALGRETDTLDADGVVVHEDVTERMETWPLREDVERIVSAMVGEIAQVPPMVSAIKKDGVPLHVRARRGETMELEPRRVMLHAARVQDVGASRVRVWVECSKGFYVRSFARDVARGLGTVGHLTMLRRTHGGGFGLSESVASDVLMRAARGESAARDALRSGLHPLHAVTRVLDVWRVEEADARSLRHGRVVRVESEEQGERVVLFGDDVVCLATLGEGFLRPRRVFPA